MAPENSPFAHPALGQPGEQTMSFFHLTGRNVRLKEGGRGGTGQASLLPSNIVPPSWVCKLAFAVSGRKEFWIRLSRLLSAGLRRGWPDFRSPAKKRKHVAPVPMQPVPGNGWPGIDCLQPHSVA